MSTNVYLKNKLEERASQAAVLEGLEQKAADEKRDLNEHERETYDGIVKRLVFLDDEIGRITEAMKGSAKFTEIYGGYQEVASQQARQADQRHAAQAAQAAAAAQRMEERMSWGARFVRSEQFKDYGGHGASREFKIEASIEERTDGNGGGEVTTGTNVMVSDFGEPPSMLWPGPTMPNLRTRLFDVIGRVPTTMGSVEYYYWFQNPEDAAEIVPEGELKPNAPLQGELRSVPIATYAWWKGITRQALDDIPMIQNVIDTQLRRGVIRAINNDAAAELAADPNIAAAMGGTTLLEQIRVAIAQIDDLGYQANSVLLNPMDWAELDSGLLPLIQRDTTAPYGPMMNTQFWSLSPVAVPQIPAGTAYVGDFAEGMTYFDRQSISLLMTDSHADYFLRNKMALLAEARGKVAVTNAAIIIKCSSTSALTAAASARRAPARASASSSGSSAE
ncbi:MAG: phage major capsid protein [Actinobacteria bacterium]|nr:phage major capsid protein [Actinomycetota bacterium]